MKAMVTPVDGEMGDGGSVPVSDVCCQAVPAVWIGPARQQSQRCLVEAETKGILKSLRTDPLLPRCGAPYLQ